MATAGHPQEQGHRAVAVVDLEPQLLEDGAADRARIFEISVPLDGPRDRLAGPVGGPGRLDRVGPAVEHPLGA